MGNGCHLPEYEERRKYPELRGKKNVVNLKYGGRDPDSVFFNRKSWMSSELGELFLRGGPKSGRANMQVRARVNCPLR